MKLNKQDVLRVGDIIHYKDGNTLTIEDGLVGESVGALFYAGNRDRLFVERPAKKTG